MIVRWSEEALSELESILEIAADNDRLLASNIARRVENTLRNIELFPKAAFYDAENDFYERLVPKTRMLLIYRLRQNEAVIVATFHTSRSPADKPSEHGG